ncbi:MAG TPA: hypothetical protein VFT74_03185 [Isosphaeraceae bacterium]|nr:hypothetical protein [Isosphaeraceae bacterium]
MLVSQLLIGLIALCPLICGGESVGSYHQENHAVGHRSSPNPCPEDGDNCICQGAIQTDAFRDAMPLPLGDCLLVGWGAPAAPSPRSNVIGNGDFRLDRPGFGLLRRAVLQNFRC